MYGIPVLAFKTHVGSKIPQRHGRIAVSKVSKTAPKTLMTKARPTGIPSKVGSKARNARERLIINPTHHISTTLLIYRSIPSRDISVCIGNKCPAHRITVRINNNQQTSKA